MSAQMNQGAMTVNAVRNFITRQETKGLLRFITCGSVDDGKSSLIGRLLHDSQKILEDHMAAVKADSQRWGTQGEEVDLALLVDGLQAEREQGITIDVAYRYFDTERRKFIIADTPGHEQYTLDGGSRRDSGRCCARRAGADASSQFHCFVVGYSSRGGGGEQDGSGELRPEGISEYCRRVSPLHALAGHPGFARGPGIGAQG